MQPSPPAPQSPAEWAASQGNQPGGHRVFADADGRWWEYDPTRPDGQRIRPAIGPDGQQIVATRDLTQRQESAPVVGDEQGGRWQWNPQTQRYDIPVTAPKPAAPPPKVYTLVSTSDGRQWGFDATTSTYHAIPDPEHPGQQATDPYKAAQTLATINATQAGINSTNVQTGIAVNTDARQNAIYNRDTTQQQYNNDVALQKTAYDQGRQVAADRLNFEYTMPRQAAADRNQARSYQSQEAERRVTAATQRNTAGQTAGDRAFDRAKYVAENSVSPTALNAMSHPGAMPNMAAFTMPMPRFEDIFGSARSQAMQDIPTYGQAQAETPAYQTFEPDFNRYWQEYQQYISPYSAIFGPRAG